MLDIQVRPVTGVIGAEVTGVDPSGALDDATIDHIRKAWLDHLVLFFRDVDITPEQQIAFAAQLRRDPGPASADRARRPAGDERARPDRPEG